MDLTAGAIDPTWAGRLERTPFASALAKGAPLIVARGDPPQIVFATPSALASFRVAGARELEQVLFENNGLASRRLRRLASETPLDASPRLELLRFFVARKQVNAHWLCGQITRAGETYFVAAEPAPRSESELAAAPAPAPAEDAGAFQLRPLDGPISFRLESRCGRSIRAARQDRARTPGTERAARRRIARRPCGAHGPRPRRRVFTRLQGAKHLFGASPRLAGAGRRARAGRRSSQARRFSGAATASRVFEVSGSSRARA